MNQITTTAIVLARTDFGEADRILTLLTPDSGKLRLMAKGVRRIRSKLAGGIELFSVSDVTFMRGRRDIGTLISARLKRHYGQIVRDLRRVQLGYELLKITNKNTEDEPGEEYFALLDHALLVLDDSAIDLELIRLWFSAQLLRLSGHGPNLKTDPSGLVLVANSTYSFDFDVMAFIPNIGGRFASEHIKLLRLMFGNYGSAMLSKLRVSPDIVQACALLVATMFSASLRI